MNDISSEFRKDLVHDVPDYEVVRWHGRRSSACVLIPVINEGERIGRLLARMHAIGIAKEADIIIVDGGSRDGSLEADRLDAADVAGLLVKRGPGKLSAQLRCAYDFALREGYQEIVTIDGNDKDDPNPIPRFIAAIRDGVDFVQASRFVPGGIEENTPPKRRFAVRYIHAPLLSITSGFHWTDTTQGFRAYSRRMLADARVDIFRSEFRTYELLAYLNYRAPRLGYRCIELPTARRYPADEAVPTKIDFRGEVGLLLTLVRTCLGGFDPMPVDEGMPARGWISPGETLYTDMARMLVVFAAIAIALLTSFHIPINAPLTDLFQEGEYLSPRLFFAKAAGYPLLIHGQIDYLPSQIATALCSADSIVACTRAVNDGFTALASLLFFGCAFVAVDRGKGGRYYAGIAALILIVMVNGVRADNVNIQQGSPAIRDVGLLIVLGLVLLAGQGSIRIARTSIFVAGLIAGISLFFAYNRSLTAVVAILAYAGVAATLGRNRLQAACALAGLAIGTGIIILIDPPMAARHIGNIGYWTRHADLWRYPADYGFAARIVSFYLPVALMLGVALWVAIRAHRNGHSRTSLPVLAFLIVCCAMATQQSIGRHDPAHLSFALPWIFLLGVYLGNWLPQTGRGLDRRDILLACGLMGAVFTDLARTDGTLWPMIRNSAINLHLLTNDIPKDDDLIDDDVQAVIRLLKQEDDPCIYTANNAAALYHLVDRPPCSTVMVPVYATTEVEDAIIADLQRTHPTTIVWSSPDWFTQADGQPIQAQTPGLAAWIARNYPHFRTIGAITLRSRVADGAR